MPPFDKRARNETVDRGASLSQEDVLSELRRNGVNDLDDLVRVRLEELKSLRGQGGGRADEEERGSVLVYKCFILADWE